MEDRFVSAHAELAMSKVTLASVKCTGRGSCNGGKHPQPPLHDYPLLAWVHTGHPKHGLSVFTEDQKASVHDIAVALPGNPDITALATQFKTTEEHVRQAISYAMRAGVLSQ